MTERNLIISVVILFALDGYAFASRKLGEWYPDGGFRKVTLGVLRSGIALVVLQILFDART